MRKAVLKRMKITKTGKLLHRHQGQNHFNAKESRRAQRRKKSSAIFSPTMHKNMMIYMN